MTDPAPLPHRRAARVLASLVLVAGCGGAAKESAPATPAPEFAAPPGAYPAGDSVPGSLQQFDAAERDVYAALGASPPGEPLAGPIGSPGGAQAPSAGLAQAEPRAGGDPCATACTALASMRRSASHLCELAGEDDGRCATARGRVETATTQVRARCPACTD